MGVDLPDILPDTSLNDFNYYLDTQRLRIAVSNMKNANTKEELEEIKIKVLQHLSKLPAGKAHLIPPFNCPPLLLILRASHSSFHLFAVPSAQFLYVPPPQERAELPEEDLDIKGGGQVHDEHRVAKPEDVGDQGKVPGEDPLDAAGKVKAEGGDMEAASIESSEALKGGSRGPSSPSAAAAAAAAPPPVAGTMDVDKPSAPAPAKGMMDLLEDDS
jgi:histone deacetylase 1/2